ncbi:MAG: helix-turn-helix transcriptional regulator [Acidobacteria bacterium]|nr:helix-turn-helix transcriptional regulator [Acidobacteriota bacterium]
MSTPRRSATERVSILVVKELLKEHTLFRTSELDEAREQVAKVFCPHALTTTSLNENLKTVHNRIDLGDVALNYLDYGAEVRITPGILNSFYLVQMPLAGSARITCGRETIESDVTFASIPNPLEKLEMVWRTNNPQLLVYISREKMEERLKQLSGREVKMPIKFELGMDMTTQAAKSWRNLVDNLVEDIDHEGFSMHPAVRNQFQDLIVTGLLLTQHHNYTELLEKNIEPAAPRAVRLAMQACETNPEESFTVSQLAKIAGVSIRSLQDGFHRYVGISPTEYLKDVRLNRVRADLLAEDTHANSVSEVAFSWGFTHLGRFAHSYQKRFGELPSETLRK